MDDALIFISGVSERDIDLLLLEEFLSSETFQHWFVQQITENAELVRLRQARRSVTQSTGESDLEIGFVRSDGTEWRVLIENKVTAGFSRSRRNVIRRVHETISLKDCAQPLQTSSSPQNVTLGVQKRRNALTLE